MKRRSLSIAAVAGLLSGIVVVDVASAHPTESASALTGPPSAAFSTSGDYATDVLGDPWDFLNDDDVPPTPLIGTEGSFGISRDPSGTGILNVDAQSGSTIKLVRSWGAELPWGRDGLLRPIDAAVYSRLSFSMNLNQKRNMGVQFFTESGLQCIIPFTTEAGWRVHDIDLTSPGLGGCQTGWAGKIIRLQILAGGSFIGVDRFAIQLDWARLRRANAPRDPEGSPVVRVLTPSEVGGADYATVSGNPWDFSGPDDVANTGHITNHNFDGASYNGTTFANDSFVELPLRSPLVTDRYHRATVDVCYDGPFSFADAAGGDMNARFAWYDDGGQIWSETQDIIIYPGCNVMTIDLATNPAVAVNDENTIYKAGWRGIHISALRFDLNEDRGFRNFSLRDIRLADDAAFSSGTYPISFLSSTGGTAEIFVTSERGSWAGQSVGTMTAAAGVNTFQWSGSGLPNGTYWVYVVVRSGNLVGSGYSTGPVRIERFVPPTRSYFVPLNPARLLDTRTGEGGNISALSSTATTELKVTGVGGVPFGATAVVLNVTVDAPFTPGFITAWPSGEPQPFVSNLNYVAGQTVPNLVTVKVGSNGRVNLYNSQGYTQVLADVVGYYTATQPPSGGLFTAVTPGRVLDTRLGSGVPVAGGTAINVDVTGVAGVPATGVSGVAMNVTVDQPTGTGFLTVWPTGEPQPLASSHDFTPGLTVANLVLAKVGTGGLVSIFNSFGATHVIVDVVGYFSATGGQFVPVSPARIVDSRFGIGTGVNGPLGPGQSNAVAVAGVSPVPSNATAAIVNVTSVDATAPAFITVWPTGTPMPTASTLNPLPGIPVPNLAYLKLGTGGQLSVFNNTGSTHYIVDVFGYIVT